MRTINKTRWIPAGLVPYGDYSDISIEIYTCEESNGRHTAIAYGGKRNKADWYITFRNRESMERHIEDYLNGIRQRIEHKAAEKAKPREDRLTEAAKAAAAIRSLLAMVYPDVKFSIRSKNFSMGDSVHIDYVDGPKTAEVEHLVKQFEAGSFDGMTDMYTYDNTHPDQPQAKYVTVNRHMSAETRARIMQELGYICENDYDEQRQEWASTIMWRAFNGIEV